MQSKPKSNSVVTYVINEDGTITFTVLGAGDFTFNPHNTTAAIQERALINGFVQRISDRAAIGRDPETGHSATPSEKFDAMRELATHYESGTEEWSMVSSSGPKGGVLFRALMVAYPEKSADVIRAWLDGLSKKEQAALRAEEKIAKIIANLPVKTTSKSQIDVESLLASIPE